MKGKECFLVKFKCLCGGEDLIFCGEWSKKLGGFGGSNGSSSGKIDSGGGLWCSFYLDKFSSWGGSCEYDIGGGSFSSCLYSYSFLSIKNFLGGGELCSSFWGGGGELCFFGVVFLVFGGGDGGEYKMLKISELGF